VAHYVMCLVTYNTELWALTTELEKRYHIHVKTGNSIDCYE